MFVTQLETRGVHIVERLLAAADAVLSASCCLSIWTADMLVVRVRLLLKPDTYACTILVGLSKTGTSTCGPTCEVMTDPCAGEHYGRCHPRCAGPSAVLAQLCLLVGVPGHRGGTSLLRPPGCCGEIIPSNCVALTAGCDRDRAEVPEWNRTFALPGLLMLLKPAVHLLQQVPELLRVAQRVGLAVQCLPCTSHNQTQVTMHRARGRLHVLHAVCRLKT